MKEALNLLRPLAKSFPKPVSLFHWEAKDSNFSRAFDTDTAEGRLALAKAMADGFIKTNTKHGFYFATDPVASRSYAYPELPPPGKDKIDFTTPYRLIQMDIPQDAKLLDLNMGWEQKTPLIKLLGSILGDHSCAESLMNAMFTIPSGKFSPTECNAIRQTLFRELEVIGIRYVWDTAKQSPIKKICSGLDSSAVVITESRWIKSENMTTFTPDRLENRDVRIYLQQIVDSAPLPDREELNSVPLWHDISARHQLDDATKRWAKQHLLNCENDFEN